MCGLWVNIVFILVILMAVVLSKNQDVGYEAGIKLCYQRCVAAGSCINIRFEKGHLHCQLILQETPLTNTEVTKFHPRHQCEINHRLITSRTKESKCVAGTRMGLQHTGHTAFIPVGNKSLESPLQKPGQQTKEKTCSSSEDCTLGQCVEGSCRCQIGFYYKPKTGKCGKECTKYSNQMTVYTGYGITGYNDETFNSITMNECQNKCVTWEKFRCLTFEYAKPQMLIVPSICHISEKSYLDVPEKDREKDMKAWVLGIRDCE